VSETAAETAAERAAEIDPVTLAVLEGRLEQIADEMDATLFRSAFNPIIAEAHDASHGLYHAETGETLVQGKSGLPIFVGATAFAVKAVIEKLESRLEQLGDRNRRARVLATRGVEELEERLAVFDRHLRQLETFIPRNEEVPRLLESMAMEARRNNLGDLASINPEPAQPGPYYTRTSYEVSVIGSYHEVGRFLTAVASLPRIVTPVDLEMTTRVAPRARGAQQGDQERGDVTARFRIETYVLPDAPPPLPEGGEEVPGETAGGEES